MGSWMWMILWFGHYAKMDVGHYSLLRKCTKMKKDSQMIGWREFGGTNPFYPWIILGVYKPCKWSPANQFREIANSDPLKYVQQQICRCYTSNLFKPLWDGNLASLQHGNSSSDWPPTTARKKKNTLPRLHPDFLRPNHHFLLAKWISMTCFVSWTPFLLVTSCIFLGLPTIVDCQIPYCCW